MLCGAVDLLLLSTGTLPTATVPLSKDEERGARASAATDAVPTMTYYLLAVAPVRLSLSLKNRSEARAKVNLAARLHW